MNCHGRSEEPGGGRQVVLVGHPNVGKSALFGRLAGRYVTVSNHPGTTVEVARGTLDGDGAGTLVDTPGLHSLVARTDDERVTLDLLLRGERATVVQVADAKNLRRGLQLSLELAEAGVSVFFAGALPADVPGWAELEKRRQQLQPLLSRARALASVMLDRVLGLYILFLVASGAILLTGLYDHQSALIRSICITAMAITALFTAGFACLFLPMLSGSPLIRRLGRLPYIGQPLERLIEAVLMYRNRPGTLAISMAISFANQAIMVLAVYMITIGIYRHNVGRLSLPSMFVVLPLAESMGVIPLVAGPLEFVLNFLYGAVFELGDRSQGLVVALALRFITLTIAAVGLCYYFAARRELAQVVHQAESQQQTQAN